MLCKWGRKNVLLHKCQVVEIDVCRLSGPCPCMELWRALQKQDRESSLCTHLQEWGWSINSMKKYQTLFLFYTMYSLERFFYKQAVTASELSVRKVQNHCRSLVKGRLTFSEFNLTFLFLLDRSYIIADDYWNSASAFESETGCYESKTE